MAAQLDLRGHPILALDEEAAVRAALADFSDPIQARNARNAAEITASLTHRLLAVD